MSLTYPQFGFALTGRKLEVSRVGRIPIVQHRQITGRIKTLAIKLHKSGEWYATFVAEEDTQPIIESNGKPQAGLDVGLTDFAVLSDGTTIQNPKFGAKREVKRRRLQRWLSRKEKGSIDRKRARRRLARFDEQTANMRENFIHQMTHRLVTSYSLIAIEDLKASNMVKDHHLASSIHDASWSTFHQILRNKAESAGCIVVEVNPRNTTQRCSGCGYVLKGEEKLDLSERTFECPKCGLSIGRDLNAARNILNLATTAGLARSHAGGDSASRVGLRAGPSRVVEPRTIHSQPHILAVGSLRPRS